MRAPRRYGPTNTTTPTSVGFTRGRRRQLRHRHLLHPRYPPHLHRHDLRSNVGLATPERAIERMAGPGALRGRTTGLGLCRVFKGSGHHHLLWLVHRIGGGAAARSAPTPAWDRGSPKLGSKPCPISMPSSTSPSPPIRRKRTSFPRSGSMTLYHLEAIETVRGFLTDTPADEANIWCFSRAGRWCRCPSGYMGVLS